MAKFDVEKVKVYVYENRYVSGCDQGWYDITDLVKDEIKKEFIDALEAISDEILIKEISWKDEYREQYGESLFAWDSSRYADFLSRKIVNEIDEKIIDNFMFRTADGRCVTGTLVHTIHSRYNSCNIHIASKNIKFEYLNK